MPRMIVRLDITRHADALFGYCVSVGGHDLFEDVGLISVRQAIVGALAGLAADMRAVELAYGSVVSGTYPVSVLSSHIDALAEHAVLTAAAVQQAMNAS